MVGKDIDPSDIGKHPKLIKGKLHFEILVSNKFEILEFL